MQENSRNINRVIGRLKTLGVMEIDMLMIDGNHSVEMALNDWKYMKHLSKHGVVVIHDTSVHPGSSVLFDAIDKGMFNKRKYFSQLVDDWGIGVARKIK